jgi:hypothetical protein
MLTVGWSCVTTCTIDRFCNPNNPITDGQPLETSFIVSGKSRVVSNRVLNKLSNDQLRAGTPYRRSQVSSGSIVSDYGLDDRAIGIRSPAGEKDFSCNLCVQTGSGAHPASCTMGTGGPFPVGKSAAGA